MERWTPWIFAGTGIGAALWLHHLGYLTSLMRSESLVDAMVTFASIIVGFVGVLLGILMSIKNDAAVESLFRSRGRAVLRAYFRESIVSGILLVAFSAVLGLRTLLDGLIPGVGSYSPSVMLFVIWIGLSVFVFAATYRIVSVMMHIVFHSDQNDFAKSTPMVMSEKDKEELKASLRKPELENRSRTQ